MLRAISITFLLTLLTGCSSAPKKESKLFAAGERVTIGKLSYAVVDTTFAPTLGEAGVNQRTPQRRFVMVQVSVSNGGAEEASVPGMTIVDDSGETYPELADGTGVSHWLGVVRKVAPAQTEQGTVLFDAPARHFRLRLTDETEDDISIDVPLSFIHELQENMNINPDAGTVIGIPKK
jgi:hypothetical protein